MPFISAQVDPQLAQGFVDVILCNSWACSGCAWRCISHEYILIVLTTCYQLPADLSHRSIDISTRCTGHHKLFRWWRSRLSLSSILRSSRVLILIRWLISSWWDSPLPLQLGELRQKGIHIDLVSPRPMGCICCEHVFHILQSVVARISGLIEDKVCKLLD